MRRLPLLPTLLVAAAVAVMIALGVWQLQRAEWKEQLLRDLQAARLLPRLDLDPMVRNGSMRGETSPPIAFRRVRITCHADRDAQPQVRVGRNRATQAPGSSYFIPCFRGKQESWLDRLQVNAGWATRPDVRLAPDLGGGHLSGRVVEGVIGSVRENGPIILTADRPLPPLEASAAPRVEDMANNHLVYAFQWFFFAAAAAVIYGFALRRRLAGELPARPRHPKSRRS